MIFNLPRTKFNLCFSRLATKSSHFLGSLLKIKVITTLLTNQICRTMNFFEGVAKVLLISSMLE